jgi:hypothetical protein
MSIFDDDFLMRSVELLSDGINALINVARVVDLDTWIGGRQVDKYREQVNDDKEARRYAELHEKLRETLREEQLGMRGPLHPTRTIYGITGHTTAGNKTITWKRKREFMIRLMMDKMGEIMKQYDH